MHTIIVRLPALPMLSVIAITMQSLLCSHCYDINVTNPVITLLATLTTLGFAVNTNQSSYVSSHCYVVNVNHSSLFSHRYAINVTQLPLCSHCGVVNASQTLLCFQCTITTLCTLTSNRYIVITTLLLLFSAIAIVLIFTTMLTAWCYTYLSLDLMLHMITVVATSCACVAIC